MTTYYPLVSPQALYDYTELLEKLFGPGRTLRNLQKICLRLDLSQVKFAPYRHKPGICEDIWRRIWQIRELFEGYKK
jgi:hypothetical protein